MPALEPITEYRLPADKLEKARALDHTRMTMFVIDANSAIAPRMRIGIGKSEPVIRIDPTTEIAEIAFVSDINGVCSSRDTRPMTPRPMNVASTSTDNELQF